MILKCPIYSSQQYVKPYKDQPGGLFPLKDQQPIIDAVTWHQVQGKLKKKVTIRVTITDEMPPRGVLHCHCGRLLTGAPSRGKSGKYFYYYKCPITSKHNNISVIRSQEQLEEAFRYMSLTDLRNLYVKCTTLQKQELIRTVFDNSLYYEDRIYRTPYLIPQLAHNELKNERKRIAYNK